MNFPSQLQGPCKLCVLYGSGEGPFALAVYAGRSISPRDMSVIFSPHSS